MTRHTLMRWLAFASVLGILVAALSVAWSGQTSGATQRVGFVAQADAYVYEKKPDQNYGRSTALRADGSPVMRSYLRFNVEGLSGSVVKATLWVYAESSHSAGYEVRPVADTTWDELKITYNTAPPVGSTVVGRSGGFTAGQWTVVDVTPLVKGNGVVSLALTTSSSTQMKLSSREQGTNPPQLVVETANSTENSTPTATPTATPTPGSGSTPTPTPSPTPTPTPSPTPTPTPTPPPSNGDSLNFPIRAVFYYPWFPEAWKQSGLYPFTHYHPSLGYYDTADPAVIRQHIAAMQYGKIQAGIASWWGQGHHTDNDFAVIMKATDGTGFKWAIYHEQEGQRDLSTSEIRSDLTYIRDKYASDPNYLRVNGKFVVFVYNADDGSCEVADRWVPVARELGAYLVLKVFSGYRNCANQPDSWHQYSPAVAADDQKGYSYAISPGFWHALESQPRLSRDLARWQQNIRDMVASGAPWQLITTFNEWGEGTSVESAEEWKSSSGYGTYLDALHTDGQASGGTSPTPTPTPTPTPPPSSGDPVVVVAAGDIACDPASSSWNNNNGTSSACRHKYTAQVAAAQNPNYVLVLGDNQYEDGTLAKYQQSYDPTWGQLKSITRPVPGNHEYLTSGATGYYDYFGALAGDRSKGYYAVDLGNGWIAIAVNSNCSQVGGCTAGSPQYNFVKSVLEANASKNIIVFMHHPYWSTGKYHNCCDSNLTDLYKLFTQYDVEISLAGHDHNYQRHAPQRWDGTKDPNGIRHFVNGAGGKNVQDVDAYKSANNWEFADETHFGVLVLKLYPDHYEWAFVSDSGAVLDSGSYQVQY